MDKNKKQNKTNRTSSANDGCHHSHLCCVQDHCLGLFLALASAWMGMGVVGAGVDGRVWCGDGRYGVVGFTGNECGNSDRLQLRYCRFQTKIKIKVDKTHT